MGSLSLGGQAPQFNFELGNAISVETSDSDTLAPAALLSRAMLSPHCSVTDSLMVRLNETPTVVRKNR